jgi:GNAT superfamily N-acetyltransferase
MTLEGLRYWGHDRNYPEAYEGLATLIAAEGGPELHLVFVLEQDGQVVGFYELRDRGDHVELTRMFMRPELIGHGHGRTLWNHAVTEAQSMADRMLIMSDPGAVGFYSAMGASLAGQEEVSPGFLLSIYWYDLN